MSCVTSPILLIGLGNPGAQYAQTRHNIGAYTIEAFCNDQGLKLSAHKRTNTLVATTTLAGRQIIAANLRCFMNVSGGKVAALAKFYKITPANIVVAHDDMEQDFGAVAFRPNAGDRGHNGLKDISKALNTKDYVRLSLGIGRPPGSMPPNKYVLQRFSRNEQAELPIIAADAIDVVAQAISSGQLSRP